MGALEIAGGITLIISSILLIIVALFQETKQPGLGGSVTGTTDSYLSKNKSKTLESKLVLITRILAAIFVVVTIALNLVIRYVK
ncbi:MAG: preprotein translocase subunit SecG [Oscillospiraceae bacterium]